MLDLQRQYEQVRAEVLAAVEPGVRFAALHSRAGGRGLRARDRRLLRRRAMPSVAPPAPTPCGWLWLPLECSREIRFSPRLSVFLLRPAPSCAPARVRCLPISIRAHSISIPRRLNAFLRGRPHDKLRALLPVHLYGQCADMDRVAATGRGISSVRDRRCRAGHWRALGK